MTDSGRKDVSIYTTEELEQEMARLKAELDSRQEPSWMQLQYEMEKSIDRLLEHRLQMKSECRHALALSKKVSERLEGTGPTTQSIANTRLMVALEKVIEILDEGLRD